MPKRSLRIFGFFLARPWWVNAVLGVAFYLLLDTGFESLNLHYGQLGQIAVDIFGIIPGAVAFLFLMLTIGSVIERRRDRSGSATKNREG